MKKINLLELIEDNWYVDIDKEFLNELIKKSKGKLGNFSRISKYLGVNDGSILRWLGKVEEKDTRPSYKNIKLLARLNNVPLSIINSKILGFKIGREHNFLRLKNLELNENLVRSLAFIIGDGSIEENQIRFSNSDESTVKNILSDLTNSFNLRNKPWIKLIFPRDSNKKEVNDLVNKWEYLLGYRIDGVYKKHITEIRGIPFHSIKDFVELSFYSKTLPIIIRRILPVVRKESLKNKVLAIAYLQGIYVAEGSISYRTKNSWRAIQLNMRDKSEVFFIKELLDRLEIMNSGVKLYKKTNAWYLIITGRSNIQKCFDIDLFKINSKRKNKLEEVINNYKRNQVPPMKNEERFLRIREILSYAVSNSLEISNKLGMSLIRTQVLLKKGFDRGVWNRIWDGNEFVYEKN